MMYIRKQERYIAQNKAIQGILTASRVRRRRSTHTASPMHSSLAILQRSSVSTRLATANIKMQHTPPTSLRWSKLPPLLCVGRRDLPCLQKYILASHKVEEQPVLEQSGPYGPPNFSWRIITIYMHWCFWKKNIFLLSSTLLRCF